MTRVVEQVLFTPWAHELGIRELVSEVVEKTKLYGQQSVKRMISL